ncbi:MAG: PKD domain-containing protein [Cyclobacteriaceae bacterium]
MKIFCLAPTAISRTVLFLSVLFIITFISSCGDDEEVSGPVPIVSFSIDKAISEPGVTVEFTNATEMGVSYEWDFGDGSLSESENPEHTYSESGEYTITLTATGSGGQTATATETLTIGDRWVTGFSIISFPANASNGDPWDPDFTGPELIFSINKSSATVTIAFNLGNNITQDLLPLTADIPNSEFRFTDELWQFILFDNDEPINDLDEVQLIEGLEGNPTTFGSVDYQTGLGVLPVNNQDGNVSIDVFFELRN